MSDTTSAPPPSMSGFLDPTTMMLLGMGQGFGQAAMPSSRPVPFGAVLGMGAGGMAQGAKDAQQMALQNQQLQAAQMQNQFTRAAMPAKLGFLGQMAGGGGGGPATNGGQSGGGGSAQAAQPGQAGGGFLESPLDLVAQKRYALAMGDGRTAAQIDARLQAMVGNGYAWNAGGTAAAPVPGGIADPSRVQNNSWAEAQGKVGPAAEIATDAANIEQQKKYATPGELPGGGYGAPNQMLGAPAPIQNPRAQAEDPFTTLAKRINGAENSTGNPGAVNPGSKATGNGQFLGSTWVPLVRQQYPQQTAQMSDDQVLAMRSNPDLSQQMTETYARQNAQKLSASGQPVTPGSLYLSHTLGPDGAQRILQAKPNAPTSLLFPQATIDANPQLQGQTAGGVRAWADQKMAPAPQAPQSAVPGIAQTRLPNGVVQTVNTRPLQDEQYKNDMKDVNGAADDINHAQQQQARLLAMKDLVAHLPTGANGEARAAIANYVHTYMPAAENTWLTKAASIPDASLAQELQKFSLVGAGSDERGVLGGRGSIAAINVFTKANPGLHLTGEANNSIINMQLVQHQADIDYARGMQQFVNEHGQNYIAGKDSYHPATEFDQQWHAQHNPQVYAAAMAAMGGQPFDKWSKFLQNKDEGLRTMQLIGRIDPTATVMNENKQPMPVTAFMPQQQASN